MGRERAGRQGRLMGQLRRGHRPAAVRVLRDIPPAGEEAQVDYGLLGRWFAFVS